MEDFHEQQEAARRNEAADGANLQVYQQADHEQSHPRQLRRFQSICSLSSFLRFIDASRQAARHGRLDVPHVDRWRGRHSDS